MTLKNHLLGAIKLCFAATCILMDIAPDRTEGAAAKKPVISKIN